MRDREATLVQSAKLIGFKGEWFIDYRADKIRLATDICRMFDLNPDDAKQGIALGLTDRLHHPDDLAWIKEVRRQPPNQSGLKVSEYRVLDRTDTVRWVQIRSFVTMDRYGIPVSESGMTFDVTDLKKDGTNVQTSPHAPLDHAVYTLVDGLLNAHQAAKQLSIRPTEQRLRGMLIEAGRLLASGIPGGRKPLH